MSFSRVFRTCLLVVLMASVLEAQTQTQSSPSSSSSKHAVKPVAAPDSSPGAGEVSNGVYRNKSFGFFCKIPAGWVLRTEEMNAREGEAQSKSSTESPTDKQNDLAVAPKSDEVGNKQGKATGGGGRVLLAAFSRPPEATAVDVNSSILIAAESATLYPGLKDAAQYFGPVTEVARVQGLEVANEPYEFTVGRKNAGRKSLARADFQKNVGPRIMRQSTLVMLVHGKRRSNHILGRARVLC